MTPLMRTILVALVALPMAAVAQRPAPAPRPVLPAEPREPRPAPMPRPAEEPFMPMPPMDFPLMELPPMGTPLMVVPPFETAEFSLLADEMRLRADDMRLHAVELSSIDVSHLESVAEIAASRIADNASLFSERAAMVAGSGLESMRMSFGDREDRLTSERPRAPWASEDPADSLYRLARETLNRGEYRRAAQFFNEVTMKYKTSQYARHSAYWEAFARYRLGTTDELKVALNILEGKGQAGIELQSLSGENSVDVPSLRARVLGALAARGDAAAARQLQSQAAQSSGCDREEVSVRAEALAALGQMDMAAAMPTIRRVLANRDDCTVQLRTRALYLLGRQPVEGRVALLVDVAKNDTDAGIRGEAMTWVARVADDQAVPLLEELLRTSTEERTQRSAISALGSVNSDAARRAVRAVIERADVPEGVRYDAIANLTRTRNDREPTADDIAFLRALYPKLTSPRLRQAVLTSLARLDTPENKQFFLALVRDQREATSVRASAMQRLGALSTLDELARLYDIADARSLREQVLQALYRRKEPEAVDKIMEIARKDTDPAIRRSAINLIARRAPNDPKAQKFLQEIFEPK
ncbi:MAG: HEAT repeat domain-containing protein [Gemmatimonadaceae bacterium]